MFSIRSRKCLAAAMLVLTLASGTAQAALSQWQAQVARQLNSLQSKLQPHGFVLTDADSVNLPRQKAFERTVTLRAGNQYAFAIACDEDCGRATLRVFDENDNAVGDPISGMPVVIVTPRWTGPFRLTASLTRCLETTCEVGVALFRR
jgi:hypothetical protein